MRLKIYSTLNSLCLISPRSQSFLVCDVADDEVEPGELQREDMGIEPPYLTAMRPEYEATSC